MAEAGNPAMAEVQKPMGAVDRVKGKMREMFTPTGRAEVMAQKQIDFILAQVPEDKRAEAMELLEKKRPELVQVYMGQAQGSLVRDAAIVGGGVVVTVGGLYGLSRVEGVRNAASGLAKKAAETGLGKGALSLVRKGKDAVGGAVNWILRRKNTGGAGVVGSAKGWEMIEEINEQKRHGGASVVSPYEAGPNIIQSVIDKLPKK